MVVVGAGQVGATICYALMLSGIASTIVLINRNTDLSEGHAMDLNHGLPFVQQPARIFAGNYSDCRGADIVVLTAGASLMQGEAPMANGVGPSYRKRVQNQKNTATGVAGVYQENPESRSTLTWEVDPLLCPHCGGLMKLISFIYERKEIRKILVHLGIFKDNLPKRNRAPPVPVAKDVDTTLEPYDDGWPGYEEPIIDGQT